MYRILFKNGYQTLVSDFEMFYNSCKSLFDNSFFARNFKEQNSLIYIVKCNDDNELEFYFDTRFDDTKIYLESFLKTLFTETADVIKWEYDYQEKVKYCNSFSKYDNSKDYMLLDFDKDIIRYILTALRKNVQIKLEIYINHLDQFLVDLKVQGLEHDTAVDVKALCKTIQQNTSKEKSLEGRNIKLHVLNNNYKQHQMELSISEILNFGFIPYNNPRIPTTDKYTRFLSDEELNKGISAGYSSHVLQEKREVKIPMETLRRHFFCTGQTGAGKSSVLEEMIYSMLKSKIEGNDTLGFTLFDPKFGACLGVQNAICKLTADGLIEKEKFMEKVRYINLTHDDCNFGINVIDKSIDPTELISYFKQVFKTSGVQIERFIIHAVNLLVRDTEEHSIGDILRLFEDEEYRVTIYNRVVATHGESVRTFISTFHNADFKPEQVQPIINRIAPFVADEKKMRIFSSKDNLHLEEWIEKGYIIMFNLDGFSKLEIEMIVGFITLKYYLYAMSRNEGAHSHFLLVDEAHDVQLDIFEEIISKARSKGLHLGILTQFLEQMNASLLGAITGNMSTKIILQQGEKGAKLAGDVIGLDKQSMMKIKKMQAYLATEDDNNKLVNTLINCKPPYRYDSKGHIMPYSSDNEKLDKKFKHEIRERNDILKRELEDNMKKHYPKSNTKESEKVIINNILQSNQTEILDDSIFI